MAAVVTWAAEAESPASGTHQKVQQDGRDYLKNDVQLHFDCNRCGGRPSVEEQAVDSE